MNKTVSPIPAHGNHMAVIAQLFRYGVSGGAAALLYTAVYWVLVSSMSVNPITANILAWFTSLVSSYALHSRWSFRDQVQNSNSRQAMVRFLYINLAGLALNSLWVLLLVNFMKLDARVPLIPILLITPCFMFFACRKWAFR